MHRNKCMGMPTTLILLHIFGRHFGQKALTTNTTTLSKAIGHWCVCLTFWFNIGKQLAVISKDNLREIQ